MKKKNRDFEWLYDKKLKRFLTGAEYFALRGEEMIPAVWAYAVKHAEREQRWAEQWNDPLRRKEIQNSFCGFSTENMQLILRTGTELRAVNYYRYFSYRAHAGFDPYMTRVWNHITGESLSTRR